MGYIAFPQSFYGKKIVRIHDVNTEITVGAKRGVLRMAVSDYQQPRCTFSKGDTAGLLHGKNQ